jgi:hypothetical protein
MHHLPPRRRDVEEAVVGARFAVRAPVHEHIRRACAYVRLRAVRVLELERRHRCIVRRRDTALARGRVVRRIPDCPRESAQPRTESGQVRRTGGEDDTEDGDIRVCGDDVHDVDLVAACEDRDERDVEEHGEDEVAECDEEEGADAASNRVCGNYQPMKIRIKSQQSSPREPSLIRPEVWAPVKPVRSFQRKRHDTYLQILSDKAQPKCRK